MDNSLKSAVSGKNSWESGNGIELLIRTREKELGGVAVRRVLPFATHRMVGPWIFFDHLGPAEFKPGEGMDVLPHPHINLATVTYVLEGQIIHRDSLGVVQPIEPGAINLMMAGRGIAHSERSAPELRARGFRLQALQLWLALPEAVEEIEPAFYHYAAADLPGLQTKEVRLRVMIGEAFGLSSPVKTFSPTLYAEATLMPGARLVLPSEVQERAVYVVSGAIRLNAEPVPASNMAVCQTGAEITLETTSDLPAQIAIIGGDPPGPRHIWWNFVSSRKERIEQAKRDWQEGRFSPIPGETEFTPLPLK